MKFQRGTRTDAEATLKRLGLTLPATPTPVANYVRAIQTGNLLFLAGHLPIEEGRVVVGKLGRELGADDGYQAARLAALNCLSSARAHLGSLNGVKRVVKIVGLVCSTEGFTDQPRVLNGCSDLLVEIFGESGRHARSAIGVNELPLGAAVEIEMVLDVGPARSRKTQRSKTRSRRRR